MEEAQHSPSPNHNLGGGGVHSPGQDFPASGSCPPPDDSPVSMVDDERDDGAASQGGPHTDPGRVVRATDAVLGDLHH